MMQVETQARPREVLLPVAQSDLNATSAFWILCAIYLLASFLRYACSQFVSGPAIFNDEWHYVAMARSLPLGQGSVWNGMPTFNPCWFYPLLIAPLIANFSMSDAWQNIHLLNSFLITLVIWPAYGLAGELGTRR